MYHTKPSLDRTVTQTVNNPSTVSSTNSLTQINLPSANGHTHNNSIGTIPKTRNNGLLFGPSSAEKSTGATKDTPIRLGAVNNPPESKCKDGITLHIPNVKKTPSDLAQVTPTTSTSIPPDTSSDTVTHAFLDRLMATAVPVRMFEESDQLPAQPQHSYTTDTAKPPFRNNTNIFIW